MFIHFDTTHERDRHTDTHTQTPQDSIGRAYAQHRAAKFVVSNKDKINHIHCHIQQNLW